MLAARLAGLDPLIAITTNSAARYPGNGNPDDPANPSANQYWCGFEGIVSTLDAFAARGRESRRRPSTRSTTSPTARG